MISIHGQRDVSYHFDAQIHWYYDFECHVMSSRNITTLLRKVYLSYYVVKRNHLSNPELAKPLWPLIDSSNPSLHLSPLTVPKVLHHTSHTFTHSTRKPQNNVLLFNSTFCFPSAPSSSSFSCNAFVTRKLLLKRSLFAVCYLTTFALSLLPLFSLYYRLRCIIYFPLQFKKFFTC